MIAQTVLTVHACGQAQPVVCLVKWCMALDDRDYMRARERVRFEAWLRSGPDTVWPRQAASKRSRKGRGAPRASGEPWWVAVLWWLVIALVVLVVVKRLV